MIQNQILRYRKKLLVVLVVSLILSTVGCVHLHVDDCGGTVLGKDELRIRSSHYRMLLADVSATADRFLAFAAMSSLAYSEDQDCGRSQPKVSLQQREKLEEILTVRGWKERLDPLWIPACEDDVGLYFRVWERTVGSKMEVTIAFRGTWGLKDWLYGNAHWVTRILSMEDQYGKARMLMEKIFKHYEEQTVLPLRFFTTGHSLGGGLAQHILYSNPQRIVQAITFDPSSVTGFTGQTVDNQIAACSCDASVTPGEPRIYRIYASYEILSNLRIFHKILFPPERHIQEVRFPKNRTHSMLALTDYFIANITPQKNTDLPWFQGVGLFSDSNISCTRKFIEAQEQSCSVPASKEFWNRCPR